jgi:hypothetical protein
LSETLGRWLSLERSVIPSFGKSAGHHAQRDNGNGE